MRVNMLAALLCSRSLYNSTHRVVKLNDVIDFLKKYQNKLDMPYSLSHKATFLPKKKLKIIIVCKRLHNNVMWCLICNYLWSCMQFWKTCGVWIEQLMLCRCLFVTILNAIGSILFFKYFDTVVEYRQYKHLRRATG